MTGITRPLLIAACALALAGCDNISQPDQCMRAQLFTQCMGALPAGPVSTKYNDWDEVVQSCASAAYYQSLRSTAQIKQECRP